MKHIKLYEEYQIDDELNEGVKDWIIGGLIALSSVGSAYGQDFDKSINVQSPTTKTEYQVHQDLLDYKAIDGFLKYSSKILSQSNKLSFSKEGKFTLIKGDGFIGSISQGTGYNKYSCFIGFGDENKPDAQINITLKDDGAISLIFGEDRLKEDQVVGDFVGTRKKGTQLMDQTELWKGDKGYDEALKILNLFNKN